MPQPTRYDNIKMRRVRESTEEMFDVSKYARLRREETENAKRISRLLQKTTAFLTDHRFSPI